MTLEEKKQELTALEWKDFTRAHNIGGRAGCQDDPSGFFLMRMSLFEPWPEALTDSYLEDLRSAQASGRSLPAEKYAWMMEKTAPEDFARIRHLLPEPPEGQAELIREILAIEIPWFREYTASYPYLARGSRKAETDEGSFGGTSMAVYLEGELRTYSLRTLRLYLEMDRTLLAEGKNMGILVVGAQMRRLGFESIDDAEESLRRRE